MKKKSDWFTTALTVIVLIWLTCELLKEMTEPPIVDRVTYPWER